MRSSKANAKICYSGNVLREDEYGREKAVPALFVNRAFYDHVTSYRKVSDKVLMETEALRRQHHDEHAKSKEMAKDWPDSIENMEKAKKMLEEGEAVRLKEETEERHKQIAWENRAMDRKFLVDAEKMQWSELPEVREIHRAYLEAQILHEINTQKEFKRKLKEKREAERIKGEVAELRFHETEVKQDAERAMKNKNYWEYIDKQIKERKKLREADKKEKMREELEMLNKVKDELNEMSEEEMKNRKRMNFVRGLKVSQQEKNLLKAERLQDDRELERSIQAYNENIEKYRKSIMEMSEEHLNPGSSARKIVLSQAQKIWEKKVKIQMEKDELFEKQRKGLIAREEERMKEEKRKESEQKISFKLANDNLMQQKLQQKLLSQKIKNLEQIQMIKLFEKEKENKINKKNEIENENKLARLDCAAQEAAKAREKKLYLEDINDFMKEKNIVQEKFEKNLVEYAKKLSKELQSENKDSRPVDNAILLREKQRRMVLQ